MLTESIYTRYVMNNIARILTQVDRDIDSRTYGSCDRNYWHLKIRDFTSAILQQTGLTMALLYNSSFEENIFYKNENLKQWAIATLKYLKKIQLKDGSFNEYYPNEHGFPPTAFILFAGCKIYIELEMVDEEIKEILKKAAEWLSVHKETKAYNQEWAAIAGLYLYYKISMDQSIKETIDAKVKDILQMQSREGWFPEQGGADIGYSSVALDMMMEYYWESKDERVKEPAKRLVSFLSYFIHPDATIGGEYGSRNTIYFMPNGLETYVAMGMDSDDIAKSMIQILYKDGVESKYGDFMEAVDERYLTHYVMHSYLRAVQRFKERATTDMKLPCNTVHKKVFKDAGLITMYNGNYYAVVSTKKGGVLKIYREKEEKYWDCGYRIPIKEGEIAATNWLDNTYKIEYTDNGCCIWGKFNVVKQKVQTPIYHLGLRISALFMGDKVNKLIKKLTIFQKKNYSADFYREICMKDEKIVIVDEIHNPEEREIFEASNISLRLVASGKFFSRSDILMQKAKRYGNRKKIKREKIIDIIQEKVCEKIF